VSRGLDRLLVHASGLRRHRGRRHVLRNKRRGHAHPVFLIGFPLFDVPPLTTVEAIGTSLLLETSGFGTGLYRYFRLHSWTLPPLGD